MPLPTLNKICAALALCACANLTLAAPYDYVITKLDNQIQLDHQRRSEQTVELVVRLDTVAAVQQYSQMILPYVKGMSEVELLEAQTLKADGRVINVDKNKAVFDQPLPLTLQAPMYSQAYVKSMVFPSLEVGDSIRLRYLLREKESLYPGYFSFVAAFPPEARYADVHIRLRVPADVAMHLEQTELPPATVSDAKGWKEYDWRYTCSRQGKPDEAREISPIDNAPRLIASTFSNWAEFAAQYQSRAADKVIVTPAIQTLADEITKGVTERREQARLLYNWVNLNLRYVAIMLGAGAVVPHEAPSILSNRYGDCKDHDTLLAALLKAKGIDSSPALVNAGEAYRLPGVALSSMPFNHVITYLPEFDLFVDATNKYAAFGELPFSVGDKPVLLAKTGDTQKTPAHSSANTFAHFSAQVTFDENGNATVAARKKMAGYESSKYRISAATQNMAERSTSMLAANKMTGDMAIDDDPPAQLATPYEVRWKGRLQHLGDFSAKYMVLPRVPMANDLQAYANKIQSQQTRQQDAICPGKKVELDYRYSFPATRQIQSIPTDVDVQSQGIRYRASYRQEGNTVIVYRMLDRPLASNVCTAEQLRAWQSVAEAILKDHRAAVLFK